MKWTGQIDVYKGLNSRGKRVKGEGGCLKNIMKNILWHKVHKFVIILTEISVP
jgi:hypothetical protein